MVDVRPIRTEAALARVDELMDARDGMSEEEELEVLVTLVEVYEDKHYPLGCPDPVAAIKFCIDQQDLTPRDLIPYIGSRVRVSEVLSGKRPITMSMARALHEHLAIPAEVLLQKPAPDNDGSPVGLAAGRFPLKAMAKRGLQSTRLEGPGERTGSRASRPRRRLRCARRGSALPQE